MQLPRRDAETGTLALFEASGANARRAAELLRDLLSDYPERSHLAQDLRDCEHEGDRITHDIIHRLAARDGQARSVEPQDGHALATALDDIVDNAEQAGDWLGLYAVEAPMEQAVSLAQALVSAAEHVELALRALRTGADVREHLVAINRFENDGDRLHREAVASLFVNGIDPMVVIRWKDIFASIEASVDSCETVAHVLEGILLKRDR